LLSTIFDIKMLEVARVYTFIRVGFETDRNGTAEAFRNENLKIGSLNFIDTIF